MVYSGTLRPRTSSALYLSSSHGLVRKGNSPVRRISRRHYDIHPRERTNTGCKLKWVTKMVCGISPSRTKLTKDCDCFIWTRPNRSIWETCYSAIQAGRTVIAAAGRCPARPKNVGLCCDMQCWWPDFITCPIAPIFHQAPTNGRT